MENVTALFEISTGENCPGCGGELVLGSTDRDDAMLSCDCSGFLVA